MTLKYKVTQNTLETKCHDVLTTWHKFSELLTSHLGRVSSRVTSHEGRVRVESRVTEISARVESSHESQGSRVESSRVTQSYRVMRLTKLINRKRDRILSVYITLKSESKIKINIISTYYILKLLQLTWRRNFQIEPIPFRRSLNDHDLPVAKWLERDSTWLVRVKGSSPSRVASLRGPWLESSHESQKCDSSRDSSRVTSHESTPLQIFIYSEIINWTRK